MADNQGNPGTYQAYLADGRVDNITSVSQADAQINNYENDAADQKAIMDGSNSLFSRQDKNLANARYNAAETDITQVRDARNQLMAAQQSASAASSNAQPVNQNPSAPGIGTSSYNPVSTPTAQAASASTTSTTSTKLPNGISVAASNNNDFSALSRVAGAGGSGTNTSHPTASTASATSNPTVTTLPNGINVAASNNNDFSALSRVAPSGGGGYANVPRTPNPASLSHTTAGNTGIPYKIQPGDTLSAIADHYGVPLSTLEAANKGITNPNLIFPGQHIDIPGSGTVPSGGTSGVGGGLGHEENTTNPFAPTTGSSASPNKVPTNGDGVSFHNRGSGGGNYGGNAYIDSSSGQSPEEKVGFTSTTPTVKPIFHPR
jgi:LysM repeat protein